MTDTAPEPQPAPAQAMGDPDAVGVDFQAIINGYTTELAEQVQRRIMAEATAATLRGERAAWRAERQDLLQTIHALSPGAPTTDED